MTALSFILGIWPLVTATGAGAGSRQSLGTAVFGGMVISTFLSLFIVPVLYIVINNLRDRFKPGGKNKKSHNPTNLDHKSEVKSPTVTH
jgi:HAE1 family hydrophobic/amphiphilic exporter-1